MEDHLARALIELEYALADFDQTYACGMRPKGSPKGEEIETLFVALRLSRWGLEAALRALHEINTAAPSTN